MEPHPHDSVDTNPVTEQEKRFFHLYGKKPKGLLQNQLKGGARKYFDSGDFALTRAHKSTDVGAIETGKEHPLAKNISHPFSPIPSGSNVNKATDGQSQVKEDTAAVKGIHLLHGTNLNNEVASGGNQLA
ncbi:MAG: hypothetical protein M1834_002225 [Cirrosporium novae-zelandiae]|nr:MAG: hypothetical protein M1834_002225 [Cirrosporium novae-zelandiae]